MLENIDNFLKIWKDIFYVNLIVFIVVVIKEIENLKKYVRKGCFLYIFVGCGSERNKNLYWCL